MAVDAASGPVAYFQRQVPIFDGNHPGAPNAGTDMFWSESMNDATNNAMIAGKPYSALSDTMSFDGKGFPDPADPGRYQSLSGLLRVLRRRWKLATITALTVFALGAGVYFLIAAYSATTIIEINKDDPTDNDGAQSNGPVFNSDDIKDEVQTDVNILQTDDSLALAVIQKLNLLNEPAFRKAINSGEKGNPIERAPKTRDAILDIFHSHLKVDSPADSRLITISYKSSDPFISANITNTLARTFIDDTLSRRKRSILTSSDWLRHELEDLKTRAEDSQQKLADYERQTGMAGVELTGATSGNGTNTVSITPQNTVTARLFALNQELTEAEANRISTEAVDRLVKSNDPDIVLGLGPMAVSNTNGASSSINPESIAVLSQLRAQETDLERQLSAATVKYGENNPRRMEIQNQLDSLRQQVRTELGRMRQRAANAYNYAKINESSIRQQFQKQEGAANDMADKNVKLQLLAQEAFSNQSLYDNLFSKLQTATLASGTRATRIEIVDEAIPVALPNIPKLGIYAAAVLAAGLFFGVTFAFLRESMDGTVRTLNEVPEIFGHVFPGYIPRTKMFGSDEVAASGGELITSPSSPFSESIRSLRTALSLAVANKRPRTILVTSALGSAGKSTLTYNLGVAYAQQGARVLLIDCDLRNPDLHRFFSWPATQGLTEACADVDSPTVTGLVQHTFLPTLSLLPAGEPPALPSEFFASPAFEKLLKKVSGSFDYILLDSPPILAVTDASVIATKVNAVVAVVRSRNTTKLAVSALAQALHRTDAPVFGFVLNDVDNASLDGFHEYGYARGKGDRLAINA